MTTKVGYGLRVCFDLAYADNNNMSPGKKSGSFKNKTAACDGPARHLQFDEVDVGRRRLFLSHVLGSEMFLRERRSSSGHLLFDVALQIISPDKHNILCEWHEHESTKALTDGELCFF